MKRNLKKRYKKSLNRCLLLMFVLTLGAAAVFGTALVKVDGEKAAVAITEEVIAGNPAAAEGLTLEWKTHWDGKLLWDTRYRIGSGETESDFTFDAYGKNWNRKSGNEVMLEFYSAWGASGEIEPSEAFLSKAVEAVAARTLPGETHSETIRLADYYDYCPVQFDMSVAGGVRFDETDWGEFFRIPVQDDTFEMTVQKNAEGKLIAVDITGLEGGINPYCLYTFGEKGVYFVVNCEDSEGNYVAPEGKNGIFFCPYGEGEDGMYVTKDTVKVLCELPEVERLMALLLDEQEGCVYFVSEEQEATVLNKYLIEEELVPQQRLEVCEARTKEAYWRGIYPTEGGLLLTWSDSGFAFVDTSGAQCEVFCSGEFPDGECEEEPEYYEGVFPVENSICFDGERLALAAYCTWSSVDANLAVYGREGLRYHGVYHNSGELERAVGFGSIILPQGGTTYYYHRGNVGAREGEPLRVEIDEAVLNADF